MEKQRTSEQWMREDARIRRGEEENKEGEIRRKRKGGLEVTEEEEERRKWIREKRRGGGEYVGAMQHADSKHTYQA